MIPCPRHGITDDVSLLDLCDSTVLPVKTRIHRIKILRIHAVLRKTEGVAKSLIMHQLAFAEEFEGLADVGVVYHTEQVVVCDASLLLC